MRTAFIYLKSIFVGIVAFLFTYLLYALTTLAYFQLYLANRKIPLSTNGEVDLTLIGIRLWPGVTLALVVFGAVSYWAFRSSGATESEL